MKTLLLLLLLPTLLLHSGELYIGPEFYHMVRWREGGARQSGWLYGGRVGYDRIVPASWYAGVDYLYAVGKLDGHTGARRTLRSDFTDSIIEGRIGYTLFNQEARCAIFTPFAGYGYFHEINDFQPPSPLPCKFTDTFNYFVVGFLSGVNFTPLISMGINFKVRFMLNGESEVTDDPLFDDQTLTMNNETYYRLEIPATYRFCCPCSCFSTSVVPFYEFRHFGGREDFPFGFIDTKFRLLGVRIDLAYRY